MIKPVINVRIGEVKAGKKGVLIQAILGSCLGIGMIWEAKKKCALAHCLLPKSPQKRFTIDAKFVDTAVPSLLALLRARDKDFKDLKILLAGGSNMTDTKNEAHKIGKQNILAAKTIFNDLGLEIFFEDLGGTQGRKLMIDCDLLTYKVVHFRKINVLQSMV